jgi:transposase
MSNMNAMKTHSNAMHVAITNRTYKGKTYSSTLLRQTYREDGKVKHRTLANLSALPEDVVDIIRRALKGEAFISATDVLKITSSKPHGAVCAVLSVIRKIGLDKMLGGDALWRSIVLGMMTARLVEPGSKRFTAAYWQQTTLGSLLSLPESISPNALYEAMDTLFTRQSILEKKLAKKHLEEGALVLYDLSSSYLEGTHCPLAAFGYSRDKKRSKKQFTYGLMTNKDGCPVAVEVFPGNRTDAKTLEDQITRLREKYGLRRVVLVGDRGMITKTRIIDLKNVGYDWITALRASDIQHLYEDGAFQLSLFDERDVAEIEHPDYEGERLVLNRNPLMTEERRRNRQDLLLATERNLEKIRVRVETGKLVTADKIGLAVGKVIDKHKMAKHFILEISDGTFQYRRDEARIEKESRLDGIYIVRTDVPHEEMSMDEVVKTYKGLQQVEQAFRNMKSMQLELRPVFHRLEDRVRAHVFLCMLAYYVQWHMVRSLRTLKEQDAETYGSFRLVMERLKSLQRNTVECAGKTFEQVTQPDAYQQKILDALGVVL